MSELICMRRLLRAAGADGLTDAQLAARVAAPAPPESDASVAGASSAAPAAASPASTNVLGSAPPAAGPAQSPSQAPGPSPRRVAALLRMLRALGLARHAPAFSGWVTVAAEHAGCYLVEPPAPIPAPGADPAQARAAPAAAPAAASAHPAGGSFGGAALPHARPPAPQQPPASAPADGSTPATAAPAAVPAAVPEAPGALAAGAGATAVSDKAERRIRVPRLAPWTDGTACPNPDHAGPAGEGLGVRTLAAIAPIAPAPAAVAQTVAQDREPGATTERHAGARAAAAQSLDPNPGGARLLVPWRDHRGRLLEGMWQRLVQRALSVVVRHPGAPLGRL